MQNALGRSGASKRSPAARHCIGLGRLVLVGTFLGTTSLCFATPVAANTAISAKLGSAKVAAEKSTGSRRLALSRPKVGSSSSHLVGTYSRRHDKHALLKGSKARYAGSAYGTLQCVPFARTASGIALKGNAANWWDAAAGVYERGSRPEPGSVLNFRATGGMRLGHVAVVTAVSGSRRIEVEHANWTKGSVARDVGVIDVSPDNDWSRVRVALSGGGDYGSVYPTYGFIYDRPDSGAAFARAGAAGSNRIGSASASLDEVAEAPIRVGGRQKLR